MTLDTAGTLYMLLEWTGPPKFHAYLLYGLLFWSYRPFCDKCSALSHSVQHWMAYKGPWMLRSQRYPIVFNRYPCLPNFTSLHSTADSFRVTGHLRQRYRKKLEHYEVKSTTYILYKYSWSPRFQCVSLYRHPFSSYNPLPDNCTDWPKITLREHYEAKGTLICSTGTPSHNFHSVRSTGISISIGHNVKCQSFLKQVHQMTPKWPPILLRWRYAKHVILTPLVPIFNPFCCMTSRFWVTERFEKVHRITPKRPWTLQGQKFPKTCHTSTPESQISICFALHPSISSYRSLRSFWEKCSDWPQNGIVLQGQRYSGIALLIPLSLKFRSVSLSD